ncbi:PREDICTED: thrombomodulin [Nipponia nippon]|uniref:thrombomodulin n=1 Tax=Nipponia nippon TaxID=128390 RepID=UPI0005114081|nr:PREDICTED: thrombomodulin [Nipponia nippon]
MHNVTFKTSQGNCMLASKGYGKVYEWIHALGLPASLPEEDGLGCRAAPTAGEEPAGAPGSTPRTTGIPQTTDALRTTGVLRTTGAPWTTGIPQTLGIPVGATPPAPTAAGSAPGPEHSTDGPRLLLYYILGSLVAILLLLAFALALLACKKRAAKREKRPAKSAADNYCWVPEQPESHGAGGERRGAPGSRLPADGSSCEDNDDCAVLPKLCEQVCVNTEGGFECHCHRGYKMVEGHCRPVSRCYEAPCEQQCEDVPGGYRCSCYPGYAVDPQEPTRCLLHCNHSQCPAKCDPYHHSCECPEGFLLDDDAASGQVCMDIDECDMNFCPHNCTNRPGGYECHCRAGYRLHDQNKCIEITEEDWEGAYSGDFGPGSQTPVPSRTPPKAEHLHPGTLVGIAVGVLSVALALLALSYHLAKKHCRPPATMDYKCSGPHEKEMGLQPVASGCAASGQKL